MMNKRKNKKNNIKKLDRNTLITLVISIVLFVIMSILVSTNNIGWLDDNVYSLVSKMICEPMTKFFKVMTLLCETETILIILALTIIFVKKKKLSSYIVVNAGLCVLINQVVKRIFVRVRPIGIALIEQGGYSFPSGHSMMAFAFYGFIIYLINKSKIDKRKKIIFTTILAILTFLIGLSRIYLGVHYASDVLGGFILSFIHLIVFINFIYKKKEN